MDDLVGPLTNTIEASPTFVEAKKKLDDAPTAYDAARADVIKALEDKPEYKSPHEAELAAKAKLAKLREDTDATPEAIKAAGDEDLAQLAVVGQVERDALQADAAVQEKLAAIRAAQGVITKLRADFHTSLESNTDYTTAKKAKDDAQAKLNSLTGKQ